jgi:hypothetical protein
MTATIATAWRDRALGATALLLLAIAVGNMWFVVPGYRRMLEGLGVVVSSPARLAIEVSRGGVLFVAVWVTAVAVAYWRERKGATGALSTTLAWCALATAAYLALVVWVYFDMARAMARIQ